jgi:hypothetical protein
MSSIIFQNIIDKVNTSSNNINSYFENSDYYNTNIYDIYTKIPKSNIIIYIFIVFIVFNFISRLEIRLNEIMTFLVSVILIYILLKKDYSEFIKYTNVKKSQLDFLHKLIFNDTDVDYAKVADIFLKPAGHNEKSFLYLNPLIVEFFYNLRNYSQINISAYVDSIIHSNNVIGLSYESTIGIDRNYLNYELAIEETKKALNNLNSMIYNIPSTKLTYNRLEEGTKILHSLLNKHISDMAVIFKNDNKMGEMSIYKKPDGFYDMYFKIGDDDTKTEDYMSVYNLY